MATPRATFPDGSVRYAQLGAGRCRRRLVVVRTARVLLRYEAWSVPMLEVGRGPRGSVTFLAPVGRQGPSRIQGRPCPPGEAVVLFDGDEFEYRSAGAAQLVSVSIASSALEGHVRTLLDKPLAELRLQGRLKGLRADARALRRICLELRARAALRPGLLRDPAFVTAQEARLVRALFAGLGASGEAEPPSRGRELARRADTWLRQRLAEPPRIATLCAALGASERTLHEAFREHLDTTPKAYLKTLRLNAARHDLLRGAARTRVTDVALDWGFQHFGWFSQDYKRLFGETPSQTLHRGRGESEGMQIMNARPLALGA
jgi:AraC family ethanolamine operon transcriptional activator